MDEIERCLQAHPDWSERQIAGYLGCTRSMVWRKKQKLKGLSSSTPRRKARPREEVYEAPYGYDSPNSYEDEYNYEEEDGEGSGWPLGLFLAAGAGLVAALIFGSTRSR